MPVWARVGERVDGPEDRELIKQHGLLNRPGESERATLSDLGGLTQHSGNESSLVRGVRERRGRLAADDRRGLVDELVVL